MKVRKKQNAGKYTIGPHGEIYNNKPELSERTQQMLNTIVLEEAIKEAVKEADEDDGEGTSEGGTESVCD